MIECLSSCRYSIGSSRVMMWCGRVRLMWSIIAARVVLLPEPVVPVTRMIPRCSSASFVTTGGRPELLDRADLVGDRPADDRDRAALLEGVDPEPREAGDRVGEVGLAALLELLQRALLGDLLEGALGVLRRQRLMALEGHQLAVHADGRRRADFDVKVRPLTLDQRAQCCVDLEHPGSYRPGCSNALAAVRWPQVTSRSFCASPSCCSFFRLWFSIWRIRSRVTLNVRPTSSRVRGCSPPSP